MPDIIRKYGDKWILVDRVTNKPYRKEDNTIIRYDTRGNALAASQTTINE